MAAQRGATHRNEAAEAFVDAVLCCFAAELVTLGYSSRPAVPERHVPYSADDCSDVFDHRLFIADSSDASTGLTIWAQTTCYKGNAIGRPEANKVYEVRETIIEALGLRRSANSPATPVRLVHFLLGNAGYAYDWARDARDNAFDLSMYPPVSLPHTQLFSELIKIHDAASDDTTCRVALISAIRETDGVVAKCGQHFLLELINWAFGGMPANHWAVRQSDLLATERTLQSPYVSEAIQGYSAGRLTIKHEVTTELLSNRDEAGLSATARSIASALPFVSAARVALKGWPSWCATSVPAARAADSAATFALRLWQRTGPAALVLRRLTLRAFSDADGAYVQDLPVLGLTEHSLYTEELSSTHAAKLASFFASRAAGAGLASGRELRDQLVSSDGKKLLRQLLVHDVANGTLNSPALAYVSERLSKRYVLCSFTEAGLTPPVAFYTAFTRGNVQPYKSMRVIVEHRSRTPLAIFKAKHFSHDEFPRRAKEESYPGLTVKYEVCGDHFVRRADGLPLIMLVDTAPDAILPEYALRRLVTAGWIVVFSVRDLEKHLHQLCATHC